MAMAGLNIFPVEAQSSPRRTSTPSDLSIVIISEPLASSAGSSCSSYDENKCRNVLVRYCAHIPRNYQYRDGIQQVFLILREHLGDENLDLAGGVLYELIEVDCEHSDDPGAAFQRWRHDHMNRHADFELPHIPHMTTITSAIRPTSNLILWRARHAERYQTRLSDHSPSCSRDSTEASCIRTRKTWIIDHTMYVSSRDQGTRPFRTPSPKEFHEMQWNFDYGRGGKLVDERKFLVTMPLTLSAGVDHLEPPVATFQHQDSSGLKARLSRDGWKGAARKASHRMSRHTDSRRRSWLANVFGHDAVTPLRERLDSQHVPLPDGCGVPNGIFARKFGLVGNSEPLPPALASSAMPTAESKATEAAVVAAACGAVSRSWEFRGPFTPQLGFDGGLDYRWEVSDPFSLTARETSRDASNSGVGWETLSAVRYSPVPREKSVASYSTNAAWL